MGIRIALGVKEPGIVLIDELAELVHHVVADVRVGVFLNRHGRRCVRDEADDVTAIDSGFMHGVLHLVSHVDHLVPVSRGYGNGLHHRVSCVFVRIVDAHYNRREGDLSIHAGDMVSVSASKGKVVVAMSGGVDSSVSACLLHKQGYEVIGLFMRTGIDETVDGSGDAHLGCCSMADASDARRIAGQQGIPFFALDFKDEFDRIIEYFVDEYQRGRTPNPCILCNEQLKFGRLVNYRNAVDADLIATGHYARIENHNNGYRLCRAVDRNKDQSYVLFGIDRNELARTLFPIGGMYKDEVRDHARRLGLAIHDKPESQDICFAPDRDYARLVRERRPEAIQPGTIVDGEGNKVGTHDGVFNFTIGQRRGLGIALGEPVYVCRINASTQTVTVGSKADLTSDALSASNVRWLTDPPADAIRASVKIRYMHRDAPATIEPLGRDRVCVQFDEPQVAITPGQAAVFYDDDVVLGGGWID